MPSMVLQAFVRVRSGQLTGTHRLQASSYKNGYKFPAPCRSQPAGEWWPSTCVSAGKDSPAGKLLQGKETGLCLCRSQPAGEWWPSTSVSAGKDSLAGNLLQGKETGLCLCRSQPAGEGWRSTGITAGKDSLAGNLLQGRSRFLSLSL